MPRDLGERGLPSDLRELLSAQTESVSPSSVKLGSIFPSTRRGEWVEEGGGGPNEISLPKCHRLTWLRLVVPEQHGVHVHEEDHAAKVEVEVERLVERRRYVRGYYFRHGKGDPHHDQEFPVQRAQGARQGVAAAETEIEAE